MGFWILFAFLTIQRLTELIIARRNERWMKAHGAYEVGRNHYKWIVAIHVSFFLSLLIEVQWFGAKPTVWWPLPFTIFALAQVMRFWALFSLGRFWNTKILVLPGANVVERGPYRFLRHPNYVIVATEILMIPLIFQAYVTAVLFSVLNAIILSVRIPQEEEALCEGTDYRDSTGRRPRFWP
jgi:methyltransferase